MSNKSTPKLRVSAKHLDGYISSVQKLCGFETPTRALCHILNVASDCPELDKKLLDARPNEDRKR